MAYSDLKTVYYTNRGNPEEFEKIYQNRLNNPSVIKTQLYPRLMRREEYETADYPIFVNPTIEILMLMQKIIESSLTINQIANSLPQVAHEQFYNEQLYRSIISTNEIEGVKTTREELSQAFEAILSKKDKTNLRHLSTVRMYSDILNNHYLHIQKLEDVRNIYDGLTGGEIAEEDKLDGKLFRNDSVYITDDNTGKTIHIPPRKEEMINRMLLDWLEFINQSDVPFLIKAIVGHYFFENIHPFYDGNGRVGRFILAKYLSRRLDKFSGLILSQEVNKYKSKYYNSFAILGNSLNRADATTFVRDILELIHEGQKLIIEVLLEKKGLLDSAYQSLKDALEWTEADKFILYLFVQSKLFVDHNLDGLKDNDIKELAKNTPHSWRTIRKEIDSLREQGVLEQVSQRPLIHVLSDNYLNQLLGHQ